MRIGLLFLAGSLTVAACSRPEGPAVSRVVAGRPAGQPTSGIPTSGIAAPSPMADATGDVTHVQATLSGATLPLAARPEPPPGVGCAVYGRGTGFEDACVPRKLSVASARHGGAALARVRVSDVDLAWGFFDKPGRAWVHAADGGLTVEGFVDASSVAFTLRREVEIVPDHVWLKSGIPVFARGVDAEGVTVTVADAIAGVSDIPAKVPCDTLLFDPPDPPPPVDPAAAPPPVLETTSPRWLTLPLFAGPGGARVATLRGATEPPPVLLEIAEKRDAWLRVRFDTGRARFDVWARARDVGAETGGLWGDSIGCGTGGSHGGPPMRKVSRRIGVAVAETPSERAAPGLALEEGAIVRVLERRGGFASVDSKNSAVSPPEGKRFWVPESALEPVSGSRR